MCTSYGHTCCTSRELLLRWRGGDSGTPMAEADDQAVHTKPLWLKEWGAERAEQQGSLKRLVLLEEAEAGKGRQGSPSPTHHYTYDPDVPLPLEQFSAGRKEEVTKRVGMVMDLCMHQEDRQHHIDFQLQVRGLPCHDAHTHTHTHTQLHHTHAPPASTPPAPAS